MDWCIYLVLGIASVTFLVIFTILLNMVLIDKTGKTLKELIGDIFKE